MDLRKEYERYQQAQRDAPKLAAAAKARNSTTSDRARAARARDLADPERLLKRVAEAQAKEARSIDRIVPSDVQRALLALMRREIKSLLPHPLRGLTDNFTDDAAPLMASLDAQGQAYWGPAPEGGTGYWSGVCRDFWGTVLLTVDLTDPTAILGRYICFHTGLSPTKHASGVWPKGLSSGAWSWDTAIRGAPYMAWEVAEAIPDADPAEYRLIAGKTIGDVRVTIPIPTAAYQNVQQGSAAENKIVTQYPRTH